MVSPRPEKSRPKAVLIRGRVAGGGFRGRESAGMIIFGQAAPGLVGWSWRRRRVRRRQGASLV